MHHVVKAQEIIASMLLTWHNLAFYQDVMRGLRMAIAAGEAARFARDFVGTYTQGDEADDSVRD